MKSFIRDILTEAVEDVNLPEEPVSAAAPEGAPEGEQMSSGDFATPPPAPTPGTSGASDLLPALPTGQPGTNTVQKEIVNKDEILPILSALKTEVTKLEKDFGDDYTMEAAKSRINYFLKMLAVHADALAEILGEKMGSEEAADSGLGEEAPMEEPMPEAGPEGGMEMPPEAGMGEVPPSPEAGMGAFAGEQQSQYTNPWGHQEESGYTNPSEAI